ncbi:bifunctional UDP-N-acetylglucosamine diphosphorylase/glucosamine-1-phosphate N-acetyltransferase GlmU [Achromobacter sp. GG226]|uniref:bifunctional UDP-N-acetylglucosamine diphosphorylase/glucosamine-1-phosphate N-acetyltransferase GlmU n=1 Tax=Verticiella alkaliphila TaxID=2779529 RepID=UPI001C0E3ED2|nr:bifunctional UDP-N-acetylglucosamine diphosphorylase/glucosamine-1-phosphate N-acetyltransferase GlmU [Verticiella sp. GG226]MBU4610934.1 bifunctional UDP-N-acetylglucosamine diphosphorylase/glucosamine-1-phosphate N-acetyltransferase GlmU [Verticiella sp. GG226]
MLNIVILAAGMGKRMRSDLPKVLHTLAGRSMLAHVVGTARALSPQRIVIVTGHGAEQVQAACAGQPDVRCVLQSPQLGTGHAVQQAEPELLPGGTTLVLYGDVPLVSEATLRGLVDAAAQGLGVLTVQLPDPTGYGRIVRDDAGEIRRIVEHKDASPAEQAIDEVNTGILAAPTDALRGWLAGLTNDNAQGEYYLTDVIAAAVAAGVPVRSAAPGHAWETLGVNSRAQQAELERLYQRHQAERLLEAGVTLADPARIDVRGGLLCGRDVFIDVNCVFEGEVELADGVIVGPNCVLRNVRVGPGARIEAFSHLEEADVGAGANVGPYARLRPGTVLGERSRVGNFVEVKNARFGADSKANHLSYVGDATVGQRVNIGAGTITCNYDGVNKHRTVIEDDAFIGSDTQLVAPVTVKRGATVGAGTTLTRDAPADTLTVSRSPQKAIEGWRRPVKADKAGR